jgi:hypothetical protein
MTFLIAFAAFVSLFDGKSLDGWTQCNGKAGYRVVDGAIVGTTAEGSPNSFLCTKRTYGDFDLELEVKVDPLLNSGVQIRSHRYEKQTEVMTENRGLTRRKHEAGRVYGYQVEIANESAGTSGGIYDEARRGWLQNTSDIPACKYAFKDNQWNHYRIRAVGARIETWVNGVPCADLLDPVDQEGFIGLQVHSYKGEKPAAVRWRNIRIQDLGRHTWQRIFDGKSLAGWKVDGGGTWDIVDGAIRATQPGGASNRGFLVSEKEYGDFVFRLNYKAVAGNSGVFFRMGDPAAKEPGSMGYEVEVDPARDAGSLQEPGKRGWIRHTGPVAETWYFKPGEWNQMTVTAMGSRVAVHINGVKSSELRDDPGRRSGRFALQSNPRQPLEAWFKDIEILRPE